MLEDDAPGAGAESLGGQNILVVFDGEYLAADQTRHADPIEQAKDHEHADHVVAQAGQDGPFQGIAQQLVKHHRQHNHHQRIGQRIDNVHDAHHHDICFAAHIARHRAVKQADEQHNDAGEKAYSQGYARAIYHADEIITPQFVRTEDVREDLLPRVNLLLFHHRISEGIQIGCAAVALTVYADDLRVLVWHNHRRDKDGYEQQHKYGQAHHGQGVFGEPLDAIFEEGGAFTHHIMLRFFLRGSGLKALGVQLQAERFLLREHIGCVFCHLIPQSKLILGSMAL
ncbi:hypothetical protein SDC9_85053 [bioreactor metagenome]|uniref:Uncharacterized protein n=1 Tax=bioreactor metagenome TaxID=1076179 RepID=A0A644ZKY4_9ZZZZ